VIFVIEDDEALRNFQAANTKKEIKDIIQAHIQALTKKLG